MTFTSTSTLSLPASSGGPYYIRNGGSAFTPAIPAAFSTAWSATGSKFAVGGQDGVVSVWDVRSSRPLRVLETERRVWARETEGGDGNGGASGWLREDPWYHQYGNAPGWGVRAVKFGSSASGREVLAFTEVSYRSSIPSNVPLLIKSISTRPNFTLLMRARLKLRKLCACLRRVNLRRAHPGLAQHHRHGELQAQ